MGKDRTFTDIIVTVVSIRRPMDYALKPVLFLLLALVNARIAEMVIYGNVVLPFDERLRMTLLTATPFFLPVIGLVTLLDRKQNRLRHIAQTDPLTGLPNRRAFLEKTGRLVQRIESRRKGVLLVLDADHFKRINDTWGHPTGDKCLQVLARAFETNVRPDDVVARIGGEEFAIFLPRTTLVKAREAAERLCGPFQIEPVEKKGQFQLTTSVGMAELWDRDLERAMQRADAALYEAKANGRARVAIWQEPHLRSIA